MFEPKKLSFVANFLQMDADRRWIQFRDAGFYFGNDEVTGEAFIADLEHLRLGGALREGNRILTVVEGPSLLKCFPKSGEVARFLEAVTEAEGILPKERIVSLGLEHCTSGVDFSFVADSADGKAALGALCNLCARHPHRGRPIVRLVSHKSSDAFGAVARQPRFEVFNWENGRRSDFDDDLPF